MLIDLVVFSDTTLEHQEVKDGVLIGVVDMDCGLVVFLVQVDKETLDNMLLDGGSGVNLIAEQERICLGLQAPLPTLECLHTVDLSVAELVELIRIVETNIYNILYLINFIVIQTKR